MPGRCGCDLATRFSTIPNSVSERRIFANSPGGTRFAFQVASTSWSSGICFAGAAIAASPIPVVFQYCRYAGQVRGRVSYFWAFRADPGIRLSDAAGDGLGYALQLAEDA